MAKAMGTFKNNTKSSILSKQIAEFHNRGFASADKVQTVLNIARETAEIKHLKNLDETKVQEIAKEIAERVQEQDITGKTGATYISALNQILDYTNHFFNKGIEQIHYSDYFSKSVDYSDKSVSEETHQSFQSFLEQKIENTGDVRFQALSYATELQRKFGLRFRESAGLNIQTIEKGLETGKLQLDRSDWTKNAREREISIRTEEQKKLLENIRDFLQETGKVNLAGTKDIKSYQEISSFRSFADRTRQEFGQIFSFHGERHHWAQSQYSAKWEQKAGVGIQSPIKYYSEQLQAINWTGEGKFYDAVQEYNIKDFYSYAREETGLNIHEIKEIDREIRQEISEELGHNRLDITNTYLGHP